MKEDKKITTWGQAIGALVGLVVSMALIMLILSIPVLVVMALYKYVFGG